MCQPTIDNRRLKFWYAFLDGTKKDIVYQLESGPPAFKNRQKEVVTGILHDLIGHLDTTLVPTIITYIDTHRKQTTSNGSFYDILFSAPFSMILEKIEKFHSQTIINILHKCRRFKLHLYQLTHRIFIDWPEIQKQYQLSDNDSLSSMQLSCGDAHFQGAQTAILRFNADTKGFVYKPVDVHIDLLMHTLRSTANGWQGYPPIKDRIIAKHDESGYYGYLGLYTYQGQVGSLREAEEVYYNFGKWLAWGKCFKIADGHSDNIIVHVPHVHWLDLEATFHFVHPIYPIHPLEETGLIYEAKPDNTPTGIVTGIQGGTTPRLNLTIPTVYKE